MSKRKADSYYVKRLDEIKRLLAEAKARGDWKTVHELNTDHHFVFRQWLGRS